MRASEVVINLMKGIKLLTHVILVKDIAEHEHMTFINDRLGCKITVVGG